jgi:hypothetical protein
MSGIVVSTERKNMLIFGYLNELILRAARFLRINKLIPKVGEWTDGEKIASHQCEKCNKIMQCKSVSLKALMSRLIHELGSKRGQEVEARAPFFLACPNYVFISSAA